MPIFFTQMLHHTPNHTLSQRQQPRRVNHSVKKQNQDLSPVLRGLFAFLPWSCKLEQGLGLGEFSSFVFGFCTSVMSYTSYTEHFYVTRFPWWTTSILQIFL